MTRFTPTFIVLPRGYRNQFTGEYMREAFGLTDPLDRCRMFAAQFLNNTLSQEHYCWMISEFKEWEQNHPRFIDTPAPQYWSDEPYWCQIRLLERHNNSIGRMQDADNDILWSSYCESTDFRGYRTMQMAQQAMHNVALLGGDGSLADIHALDGQPHKQAARFRTQAILALVGSMNTKPGSTAAASAARSLIDIAADDIPPLAIDLRGLNYYDASTAVLNEAMRGIITHSQAERVIKMLQLRETGRNEAIEAEVKELRKLLTDKAATTGGTPTLDDEVGMPDDEEAA